MFECPGLRGRWSDLGGLPGSSHEGRASIDTADASAQIVQGAPRLACRSQGCAPPLPRSIEILQADAESWCLHWESHTGKIVPYWTIADRSSAHKSRQHSKRNMRPSPPFLWRLPDSDKRVLGTHIYTHKCHQTICLLWFATESNRCSANEFQSDSTVESQPSAPYLG